MPNVANQAQIKTVKEKLTQAKSLIIVDYAKTSVKDQTTLRQNVKAAGGEVVVTKNTLIDLAVGKGKLTDSLTGMNAVVFAYTDPVAPIKAVFEFHKKSDKLTIKQGYMDDRVLSLAEVEALSTLPSKTELLAKLLMILNGGAQKLAATLQAGPQKLVYALNAVANKK